jgi:hypothetical protein
MCAIYTDGFDSFMWKGFCYGPAAMSSLTTSQLDVQSGSSMQIDTNPVLTLRLYSFADCAGSAR